jgi:hypothetical protein
MLSTLCARVPVRVIAPRFAPPDSSPVKKLHTLDRGARARRESVLEGSKTVLRKIQEGTILTIRLT